MVGRQRPDDWWQHGVIYQIYPRSFQDSNGDGVGDLPGIVARLDHLNDGTPDSLGVSAIWLSPIHPSPGFDGGYDVADYETIDPVFGSAADFERLVDEAHRRGIRVILDLVMNHTSHLHPWFRASRSKREARHRDWYVWRDAAPGRRFPNNWLSFFGGPAWEWDARTRQFYLHTFLAEQPDLNWRNPEVERAMLGMIRRWLDRGVDGFRLDVFNALFKHADLPDLQRRRGRWRGYDRLEHVHDKNQPELIDFLGRLRSVLGERPGRMAVGEFFGGTDEQASDYVGPRRLDLLFHYRFIAQPWSPGAFQRLVTDWEQAWGGGSWPCYALGSHDAPRLASRYGQGLPADEVDAITKVAGGLLLTLRGTPFVYYGEEIGMRDRAIPRDQVRDTPAIRFAHRPGGWTARDPGRTPMQWAEEPGAGFTTGQPWLPLGQDWRTRNVTRQSRDPDSTLHWYRRLIWFRRASPALLGGTWRPLIAHHERVLAYVREAPEQQLLVALNFGPQEAHLDLDDLTAGRWVTRLATRADREPDAPVDGRIVLGPHEVLILEAARGRMRRERKSRGSSPATISPHSHVR